MAAHAIFRRFARERDFQAAVEDEARMLGWLYYHPFDSRKSAEGFPDTVLVRAPRLVFAELKLPPESQAAGRPTPDQQAWLDALAGVSEGVLAAARVVRAAQAWPVDKRLAGEPSVEVYVWRPHDWFDGTIDRVLR